MPRMGITHVQSALGLILALKDDGLEEELKKLSSFADEANDLMAAADDRQVAADASMAEALEVKSEYESLLRVTQDLKVTVEAQQVKSVEVESQLKVGRRNLAIETAEFDERVKKEGGDLKKKLAAAQRAKTAAEKHEAKSLEVRTELESRLARLNEAMG